MKDNYQSWGRLPRANHQRIEVLSDTARIDEALTLAKQKVLPRGNGRSQGDVCLNQEGELMDVRALNHFLSFDVESGVLKCEAGVRLVDILELCVSKGWFLPVTPGTKFITVGGAIANDVHGKNHHRAGTFGRHVRRFELMRSRDGRLVCSPFENSELFQATIGGLGLTGVVTWAEIQLKKIVSPRIVQKMIRLRSLNDFFVASEGVDKKYEYTVAWIDCLARGHSLGRGLYICGNDMVEPELENVKVPGDPRLTFPIEGPNWLISKPFVKAFNWTWYGKEMVLPKERLVHYDSFFYPLDGVAKWNRVYGRRGFYQYQCVLPLADSQEALRLLLERLAKSQQASFLSTLKFFGDIESPGMLSFPRPGITFAVDVSNRGVKTEKLLAKLDEVVMQAGGAINPSKDARMPATLFKSGYLRWKEFASYVDPVFSSSFWRRVMNQ